MSAGDGHDDGRDDVGLVVTQHDPAQRVCERLGFSVAARARNLRLP